MKIFPPEKDWQRVKYKSKNQLQREKKRREEDEELVGKEVILQGIKTLA